MGAEKGMKMEKETEKSSPLATAHGLHIIGRLLLAGQRGD